MVPFALTFSVTSFTILNYEDKRNQGALDEGQLTDQVGYFNVGLADYNGRISTPSEARKDVNKSDIWAEANVETEIRKRHKVDKDLLETPITMEYGNYLLKFGNRSLAEGYNIDFTFNLEKESLNLRICTAFPSLSRRSIYTELPRYSS